MIFSSHFCYQCGGTILQSNSRSRIQAAISAHYSSGNCGLFTWVGSEKPVQNQASFIKRNEAECKLCLGWASRGWNLQMWIFYPPTFDLMPLVLSSAPQTSIILYIYACNNSISLWIYCYSFINWFKKKNIHTQVVDHSKVKYCKTHKYTTCWHAAWVQNSDVVT